MIFAKLYEIKGPTPAQVLVTIGTDEQDRDIIKQETVIDGIELQSTEYYDNEYKSKQAFSKYDSKRSEQFYADMMELTS